MNRSLWTCVVALLFACELPRGIGSGPSDASPPAVDNAVPPDLAPPPPLDTNQVDILFMIDNSASMGPMARELRARLPALLQPLNDLAVKRGAIDFHIGVVTSDYGAGATGAPGCQASPGGQQGRLVALGAFAPPDCKPPLGAAYLQGEFTARGVSGRNLPPGQTFVRTFDCMATVVTDQGAGCGFEHSLESVYAALHEKIAENSGFLRPDALLVVVFVSNEDDSSAPPDSTLFDKNRVAEFGYLNSFRSTRFGVVCDPEPIRYSPSKSPLANCRAAPNLNHAGPGELFDVARYIEYFTLPAARGGIKEDPRKVMLVALAAPPTPFEILLSNPAVPAPTPYPGCAQLNEQANPPCVPVLQHSCQNPKQPEFFGDPAVRLHQVVRAAAQYETYSICDADFSAVMAGVANRIAVLLRP